MKFRVFYGISIILVIEKKNKTQDSRIVRGEKKFAPMHDIVAVRSLLEASRGALGIKPYMSTSRKLLAYGWRIAAALVLAILIGFGISPLDIYKYILASKNESGQVNFYSIDCEGGWQDAGHATSLPDLPPTAGYHDFNHDTSAFTTSTGSVLMCRGFGPLEADIDGRSVLTPISRPGTSTIRMEAEKGEESINDEAGHFKGNFEQTGIKEVDSVEPSTQNTEASVIPTPENTSSESAGSTNDPGESPGEQPDASGEQAPKESADQGLENVIGGLPLIGALSEALGLTGSTPANAGFTADNYEQIFGGFESAVVNLSISYESALPGSSDDDMPATGTDQDRTDGDLFKKAEARLSFWYTLDGGELWTKFHELYEVNIANASHGGYLRIDAPFIRAWSDLSAVRVKAVMEAGGGAQTEAYIDSIWFEAVYSASRLDNAKNRADVLHDKGRQIRLSYTDDNEGENLIIKADKSEYVGLAETDVYLSLTNIGFSTEQVSLQAYFEDRKSRIKSLKILERGKPYEATEQVTGKKEYACPEPWEELLSVTRGRVLTRHICGENSKLLACDRLEQDGKSCIVDNALVGERSVIRRHDVWREAGIESGGASGHWLRRALGIAANSKSVPAGFSAAGHSDSDAIEIAPGETLYAVMRIAFAPHSSGEFYIEAVGDGAGYGLLDPWWQSEWQYRLPVVIDNTSGSLLNDYQVFLEISSSTEGFWEHAREDGGDIRFMEDGGSTELAYWLQYWDKTASSASIWLKTDGIPAGASTTVFLYYGNPAATTTSDELAVFSYSSRRDVMNVVRGGLTTATVTVFSLIDGNEVRAGDWASVNIDRQESVSFAIVSATTTISAKGPIGAVLTGGENLDAPAPRSFAAESFAIPSNRGTEEFHFYAPFGAATATIYDGNTLAAEIPVASGQATTSVVGIASHASVLATAPVMLSFSSASAYDGLVPYPVTYRGLYGIRSSNNYIGAALATTSFTIYCSSGGSLDIDDLPAGDRHANATCSSGDEGSGAAVRVVARTGALAAVQQDDSDGRESTVFLPSHEFGTQYVLPADAAYIAIACPPESGTVSLSVYDETSAFVASTTCAGSSNAPGKAFFGDADAASYNAGSIIMSTDEPAKPFYAYFENTEAEGEAGGDETNLWGAPQARVAGATAPSYTLGVEEEISPPSGSFTSALQKSGGSSLVDIAIEIGDLNKDNCRAKIEFATGTDCSFASPGDPALITASTSIQADYGNPSIDNAYAYQVGTTSAWILTSSGPNTVEFDWQAASDLGEIEGSYCLRLTANDQFFDQPSSATTTLVIDTRAPDDPGQLSYLSHTNNSISLVFGATSSDGNFAEYKIYYAPGDTAVDENDSVFSSTSDPSLGSITFASATSTTIAGLASSTQYSFAIWAYDAYGNRSSSTVVTAWTNRPPALPDNLAMREAGGELIANGGWANSDELRLFADVVNPEAGESLTVYFEFITASGTQRTATTEPEAACPYGGSYPTCSYKIWRDPAPIGDYSVSAYPASTSVTVLPDSSSGYQWQAIACDQQGLCSEWASPGSAPAVKVDTLPPSSPGNLALYSKDGTSIQLAFGASSTEANFYRYRIFYRQGSSGVTEIDSEHADPSLLDQSYGGIPYTSVEGLATNTAYVFNIWAYDQAGNKTSAVELPAVTNDPPSGSFVAVGARSDGSGKFDISVTASDPQGNPVQAKLEYSASASCSFSPPLDPTIDPTDESISAQYGDPQVDNDYPYQIGTSSSYIITASGTNTVEFDWQSATDIPDADGTYCLRLTVNDIYDDQDQGATTTILVDNLEPAVPGPLSLSAAYDDRVVLEFGATSSDTRFAEYRIYYATGTDPVSESGTLFASSTDPNLGLVDLGGAATATIAGLAAGESYSFNIWAYDTFGNRASSSQPLVVSTGYIPASSVWRWFYDYQNLTPSSSAALENAAPANIAPGSKLKLRVVIKELGGVTGGSSKMAMQYSTVSDFSSGVNFVGEIGSSTSAWNYADGGGSDGGVLPSLVLGGSDTPATHNESGTTSSAYSHLASSSAEWEFTVFNNSATDAVTYYFRAYSMLLGTPVSLYSTSSYPSLVSGSSSLSLVSGGLSSGSSTEGIVTTISTTATNVPLGVLDFDTEAIGAQRFMISSNGGEGWQMFVYARTPLQRNGGPAFADVSGTNEVPEAWPSSSTPSAFGYHAGDDTLSGAFPSRFLPNNTYARFETQMKEISYSPIPDQDETFDIIYRALATRDQEAGDYSTSIVYIITPTF